MIPPAIRQQIKNGLDRFLSCQVSSSQKKPLHLIWSSHGGNDFGWPFYNHATRSDDSSSEDLDIAVLDSSFNPPHLAHLNLAASKPILSTSSASKNNYDAHLLLLSSRNADKASNRAGDATTEQRLLMMYQLAKDLEARLTTHGVKQPAVALGIVEEPLMADKSTLIHQWIQEQFPSQMSPTPRLHWVVGYDTIVRFFAVKYYPSLEKLQQICHQYFNKERTTFVCARRVLEDGSGGSNNQQSSTDVEQRRNEMKKEEIEFISSDLVRPYAQSRSPGIAIFDLPKEAQRASSTLIRKILSDDSSSTEDKVRKLEPLISSQTMARFLCEEKMYGS
ncbi:unnamed protein product [Sympodiomycopsis kandeliae]